MKKKKKQILRENICRREIMSWHARRVYIALWVSPLREIRLGKKWNGLSLFVDARFKFECINVVTRNFA